MLGLGQIGLLQQMSSKSDTASCSVFVSNVSYLESSIFIQPRTLKYICVFF
jgi:hypothetical protein